MKKLDLTNVDKSDIQYKITSYPDGQQDITIHTVMDMLLFKTDSIQINSRFNSFKDLELIICATKALRRLGVKEIFLYIPYLLGSRSDRQFQEGGTSYLVDVIAPIINSLNFESVTVIDVHSDVASACINNLKVIDNTGFIYKALRDSDQKVEYGGFVLVSPDAGALKKIYNVAKTIDYKGEIIVASKHRDLDGRITHTEVPLEIGGFQYKDFVIIDDICDGGRTFIEIAKVIREKRSATKIFLIVTHGIFSAGLKELSEYFNHIYTTNSIMDINSMTEFGMRNEKYLNKVTQLNIF